VQKIISMEERGRLLDSYFNIIDILAKLNKDYDEGADGYSSEEELLKLIEEKRTAAQELRKAYLNGIPTKAVSKCPFTGKVLERTIDLSGINGLWWDYDNPARLQEELLPTFFAMDGALQLGDTIEAFPFNCSVGPEVPFVLPRLLKHAQIKAVLSSFPIGSHRLYFITYYSEPMLSEIRRTNDIGTYCYKYKDREGRLQHDFYEDPAKDFELEDWIRSGRLLWIEPDDENLTLRGYVTGCPYLDLSGNRKTLVLYEGRVSEAEESQWILESSEFLPDETDGIPLEEIAMEIGEEEWFLETDNIYPNELYDLSPEEIAIKINEEDGQ